MDSSTIEYQVHSADGTPIGVLELGTGPALVVVHGAWNWADHWLGVGKVLAETHRCLLMDRRARGRSGDGPDYTLEHEIEDIRAVLEAAGDGAALLGHSSGAIYALEAARRFPIDRLVLYEPPLKFRGPEARAFVDRVRAEVEAGRSDEGARIFFTEEARMPEEQLAALRNTPAWGQMASLAWTWVREWDAILDADRSVESYRHLSIPTMLLAGTVTSDHPSFATGELEEALADARTAMLEGQGHSAHRSAPELLAGKVIGFLGAAP